MIVYRGSHQDRGLWVGIFDTTKKSRWLIPIQAAKLLHLNPAMATGYSGAGCHVLAAALLLEVTGSEETALSLYQDFRNVFLDRIPTGVPFVIEHESIVAWVRDHAAGAGTNGPVPTQRNGTGRQSPAAGHKAGVQ